MKSFIKIIYQSIIGYWNNLEAYIEKHSDASFSHGICQECSDELYGNQNWYIKMKKDKEK